MATLLSTLKLTASKKPAQLPPVQIRRNKLCKKLIEQIEMVKAAQSGTQYIVNKLRTFENEKGEQEIIEVPKRLKEWWFVTSEGKLALSVRYGARTLELAKGKTAIEVASMDDLVGVLETVKAAVAAGELDTAIDAASGSLRKGFTTH